MKLNKYEKIITGIIAIIILYSGLLAFNRYKSFKRFNDFNTLVYVTEEHKNIRLTKIFIILMNQYFFTDIILIPLIKKMD